MSELKLKLYPRGFLGALLQARIQRQTGLMESNGGFSAKQFTVMQDQNNFHAPNPEVDKLYADFMRKPSNASRFDWRENFFKVAVKAFGVDDFTLWYQAQHRNPSASDTHARFLADCLQFVNTGRRDVHASTWLQLLSIIEHESDIGALPQIALDYFGITAASPRGSRQVTVRDMIQSWCSQPNGFEDLVVSLHILFGSGEA